MPEESTTPDLVEITRLGWKAAAGGELGVHSSPDIVVDTAGYGMGTFAGRNAAEGFLKDWTSAFEALAIDPDEVLDFGNGIVLTVYHQEGRPVGATNAVRVRSASISVWVDGLIVRITLYPEAEIDEARAAAERLAQERADG